MYIFLPAKQLNFAIQTRAVGDTNLNRVSPEYMSNYPETIKKLKDFQWGVGGIATDFPLEIFRTNKKKNK